jgi:hypothetical protein
METNPRKYREQLAKHAMLQADMYGTQQKPRKPSQAKNLTQGIVGKLLFVELVLQQQMEYMFGQALHYRMVVLKSFLTFVWEVEQVVVPEFSINGGYVIRALIHVRILEIPRMQTCRQALIMAGESKQTTTIPITIV